MSDSSQQPPASKSPGPASAETETAEDAGTSRRPIELLFIARISELLDTQPGKDSL